MTDHNLRVLVLTHVFPRTLDDSMGAFLLHLANALTAHQIQMEVVAPHARHLADDELLGAAHVQRFHYAPVRWEHLAYTGTMHELVAQGSINQLLFAWFNFAFLLKAIRAVRATRSQLIHAHWWVPGGLIGALTAGLTHTPLIITTHGTDVEMLRRTPWAKSLARFAFSRAHAITCGSTYLRHQLWSLGVVDAHRLRLVPMPVNPLFQQLAVNGQRSDHIILTVARLTHQKSIATLIDAIALVPDAQLHIIGDGPERANLEHHVRALNVQARVKFLGALPQTALPHHYATCAAFVLPAIREGMGLVLAEALLCGAPVIAVNSGGVTDIVRDGETGLLVPARDARALATAIETLLSDRALAQHLAEQGTAWVRAHYTAPRIAEQFAELYHSVLNQ